MKLTDRDKALLAICTGDKFLAGRDIVKLYEAQTGKHLNYFTFYTRMRELTEAGHCTVIDSHDVDGLIRSFKATGKVI